MKKLFLILLCLVLAGCNSDSEPCPECPKCPDPIVCPEPVICPPEKICPDPVPCPTCPPEKICPTPEPCPTCPPQLVCPPIVKYKYTHNTPIKFNYDKTKTYTMDIVSGVVKLYENGNLIIQKNPDKTDII